MCNKRRATNVSEALGSSLNTKIDAPNVLRSRKPYVVRRCHYLYKAIILTTNVKIEIIKLIFLYFFIVPPPPIVGRDEPNSRR